MRWRTTLTAQTRARYRPAPGMSSVADVKVGLLCSVLIVAVASIHAMGSSPRLGSVPMLMTLEARSCRELTPSPFHCRRRTRASHAAEVLGVCKLTS